ncbi:MAG: metalloregulator ArsR/SmtB family transcription factor [Promicromonosporaceae bacterium]|nr:metalloregulator ArsR/SmtB family transcription factor [Promicromonosporaceae bacterium]
MSYQDPAHPAALTTKPLYETKAGLFKALAHPSRLAALEVLAADPDFSAPVTRLLEATGADPSAFSQHMAVLKRRGVVESTRTGNAVEYRLTEPLIAELLVVARAFLVASLAAEHPDADAMVVLQTLPTIPGATAQAVLDQVLDRTAQG